MLQCFKVCFIIKKSEVVILHNFNFIFKHNGSHSNKRKIRISNKHSNKQIICQINNTQFGAFVLNQIIDFVNSLNSALKGFPIVFYFSKPIKLRDKLSYIIFECICYYLIEQGYVVIVRMKCSHDIRTCGIQYSPLQLLQNGNCDKFVKKFNNEIYGNHFCKLITEQTKKNPAFLSLLYTEIDLFLKNVGINDSRRDEVSQTISELIGNACEHTFSDCYFDIDIADDYYKINDDMNVDTTIKYYGINIVILDFSEKLLNDGIKDRIKNIPQNVDRYKKLLEAYNYHKQFFGSEYTEDDFFNIATFQNRISGNPNKEEVGGTGLTYLIKSLQEKSDSDDCYVLSGNNIIYFQKEFLIYNEDWIGFNESNDFFHCVPSQEVLNRSQMFFAGTAYNLNFVMKSED